MDVVPEVSNVAPPGQLPPDSGPAQAVADAARSIASGRHAEALGLIRHALESAPGDPELQFLRAQALFAWGRFREAATGFAAVEATGFPAPALHESMGWALFQCGELAAADAALGKAIIAAPDSRSACLRRGAVLEAQGRREEAAVAFERALELAPADVPALLRVGMSRIDRGDDAAAEAHFRRAAAANPDAAAAWLNLGVALDRQYRYDESLEAVERADRLAAERGEDLDAFVSLAAFLMRDGRNREAIEVCERRLPSRPDVEGHHNYSLALLRAGRWDEGFAQFGSRWMIEPWLGMRPSFPLPMWSGQNPGGKTILLRAEQGIGDTIQCLRYASTLKSLGATVVVQVPVGSESLVSGISGVDRLRMPGETLDGVDFWAPVLCLPRVFGAEGGATAGDIVYLRADAGLAARWKGRLAPGDGLRVGLVWAGNPSHTNDRNRSIAPGKLAPLLAVDGVRWHLLQKGSGEAEAAALGARANVLNLGPELKDFSDTVAVIDGLDLVISVDTSVAHLAGAMGKPVWLLLPHVADWRWGEEREDTPWYPTMRLFRQRTRGDWEEVAARVAAALRDRMARHGESAAPAMPASSATDPEAMRRRVTARHPAAGIRQGMCAVTETRAGIVQYRPDEPDVGESIAWYGEYLQRQLALLGRFIRPGMTVLEAGAGIGMHALHLARAVGPAGHAFLHEPDPVRRRILRQNLAANRVANATLMRGALTGPAKETLDEWQLERLHVLKVGGGVAAAEVLAGAGETVWRLRPLVFAAAADEAGLRDVAEQARAFGYRCWRVATTLFDPRNFNRREVDVFGGRKALALLAIPEEHPADLAGEGCVELH